MKKHGITEFYDEWKNYYKLKKYGTISKSLAVKKYNNRMNKAKTLKSIGKGLKTGSFYKDFLMKFYWSSDFNSCLKMLVDNPSNTPRNGSRFILNSKCDVDLLFWKLDYFEENERFGYEIEGCRRGDKFGIFSHISKKAKIFLMDQNLEVSILKVTSITRQFSDNFDVVYYIGKCTVREYNSTKISYRYFRISSYLSPVY